MFKTSLCEMSTSSYTMYNVHAPLYMYVQLSESDACIHVSLYHCRAHVTCLYSEIQFIQDFAGSVLNSEEYGYLLTQLKVKAVTLAIVHTWYVVVLCMAVCTSECTKYGC